jgi:hypothetical protein
MDGFISLSSEKLFRGIDQRTGGILAFDMDYQGLLGKHPELALPLLHFAVLGQGIRSNFFQFVTVACLRHHWTGRLFEEYFLMLLRTDLQSLLTRRQAGFFSETLTTFCPRGNWPAAIRKRPDVFCGIESGDAGAEPLIEKLLKIVLGFDFRGVQNELMCPAALQILAVQARLSPGAPVPDHILVRIVGELSRRERQFWQVQAVVPMRLDDRGAARDEGPWRRVERRWWRLRNERERVMIGVGVNGRQQSVSRVLGEFVQFKIRTGVAGEIVDLYQDVLGTDFRGLW